MLTRWESEEAFQAWRSGQAFQHGHGQKPDGAQGGAKSGDAASGGQAPPPVSTGASLLEFEVVSLTTAAQGV